MSKYTIAVIVGSQRHDSFNRKLANAIVKLAPPEFSFKQVQIDDLPLYNQDDDTNQTASVKRLKGDIATAQGLLFVTPEYNRSIWLLQALCSLKRKSVEKLEIPK
jgi:chromate reductase